MSKYFPALAVLALVSCAVKVAPTDLVGEWRMTDDAMKRLNLAMRPSFTLQADGSVTADKLVSSAFSDSRPWKKVYTGTGTWTVPAARRTQGFSSLVLDFKRSGPDEPTGLTLQIDRDSKGLYVFAWLDEEGGDRLTFRR